MHLVTLWRLHTDRTCRGARGYAYWIEVYTPWTRQKRRGGAPVFIRVGLRARGGEGARLMGGSRKRHDPSQSYAKHQYVWIDRCTSASKCIDRIYNLCYCNACRAQVARRKYKPRTVCARNSKILDDRSMILRSFNDCSIRSLGCAHLRVSIRLPRQGAFRINCYR